jgi:hypothetical protein
VHHKDGLVCVLRLDPPFDRPYVVHRDDAFSVPFRRGTVVETASRHDLDAMYGPSQFEAAMLQEVELRNEPRLSPSGGGYGSPKMAGKLWLTNLGSASIEIIDAHPRVHRPQQGCMVGLPRSPNTILPLPLPPGEKGYLTISLTWDDTGRPRTEMAEAAWADHPVEVVLTCRMANGQHKHVTVPFPRLNGAPSEPGGGWSRPRSMR